MRNEVYTSDGPLLLLAGPGTGKTYTLAKRIKHLVEVAQVNPNEITVMTFTGAAQANMREKISTHGDLFVDSELRPPQICTMHSLGLQIITGASIESGSARTYELVNLDSTKSILIGDAAQLAGHQRVDGQQTSTCRQYGHCKPNDSVKCEICNIYKQILKNCKSLDFDELILMACRLLEEHPELLAKFKKGATHLLVDEYQDINHAQFKLIKTLSEGQEEGLYVVGDDDQSIYSWRGGSPKYVRDFKKHFENAKVEPLLHSYRCHRNILEGALSVAKTYNANRLPKGEFSYENAEGPKIYLHSVASDEREAYAIYNIIVRALPSKKILILVPNRKYAKHIISRLRMGKINYTAPETPAGSGLFILEKLGAWVKDPGNNVALRESIESMLNSKYLGVPTRLVRSEEKIQERERAFQVISALWQKPIDENITLWESLTALNTENELIEKVYETLNTLSTIDQKDVPEFARHAIEALKPWVKVESFIEEVSAWINRFGATQPQHSGSVVRIMTLQSAKGLEADIVCVTGLEEGALPKQDIVDDELAEASRLMYVSMTRAVFELHLFSARTRSGDVCQRQINREDEPTLTLSRFVNAIPEKYKERSYHPPRGR